MQSQQPAIPVPDPDNLSPRVAYARATIAAPRQRVWDALVDFAAYDAWNPFVFDVDVDSISVGAPLTFSVRMSDRYIRRQHEVFTLVDPPNMIAWTPPNGLLGRPIRYQLLTDLENDHTLYQSWEIFPGVLGFLVRFTVLDAVRRGFEETAAALTAYVEQTK